MTVMLLRSNNLLDQRQRCSDVNALQVTTKTVNWNEKCKKKTKKETEKKRETEQQKYNNVCNSKYSVSIYRHIFFH